MSLGIEAVLLHQRGAAFPESASDVLSDFLVLQRSIDPVEPMDETEISGDGVPAVEREELAFDVRFERIRECHPLHGWVDRRTQSGPVDGPFGKFFDADVERIFGVWR